MNCIKTRGQWSFKASVSCFRHLSPLYILLFLYARTLKQDPIPVLGNILKKHTHPCKIAFYALRSC